MVTETTIDEQSLPETDLGDLETGASMKQQQEKPTNVHSKWLWLHAAYHCLVTILGTGILGFPAATVYFGLVGGGVFITLISASSYYTAYLLIHMQEPGQSTYSEVADGVMGKGWSTWKVRPFQFFVFFPVTAVMILIGSQALGTMDSMTNVDGTKSLSNTVWVVIMGAIIFLLSLIPDMSTSWYISIMGSIAAFLITSYCIAGSSIAIAEGQLDPHYDLPDQNTTDYIMGFMAAFGSYTFGYGFHAVIPDIQNSLHIKDKSERAKNTLKAVTTSVSFVAPAYLVVALVGYSAFGAQVNSNVLLSINQVMSHEAMFGIWTFVAIKTATEAATFNQASFTLLRDIFGLSDKKDADHHPAATARGWMIEILIRFVWAVLTTFTAAAIPFFGDLTAVTSALGLTPLSFILPILFWNRAHGETAPKWRLRFHFAFITVFVVLAVCALVGAMYDIAMNARTYQFFS